MFYKTYFHSPIGILMLASEGKYLSGVWMEGQKYFGGNIGDKILEKSDLPIFQQTKTWLERYFGGQQPQISELALYPEGGTFRQVVWDLLCKIPYGSITTYKEIAIAAADYLHRPSMSAQAIGGAVGHNPISIIIPCHRVVGSNGSLTGYAGGIERKIQLLKLEGVEVEDGKLTISNGSA